LDFEYPTSAAQGQGFADLFTALRTAFDALAAKKGDATTYQLTAAVSAGSANNAFLVVPQMDKGAFSRILSGCTYSLYFPPSSHLLEPDGLKRSLALHWIILTIY
jgi:hypothetical protein